MSRRLNIWDFDDTLVWASRTVSRYKEEYPHVEGWQWWHDPEWSVLAVLDTMPIMEMWQRLDSTPGDHWILSGRTQAALNEWLALWNSHADLGPIIDKIERVQSTSVGPFPQGGTNYKKRRWIEENSTGYDEIHVYDDLQENIEVIGELPSVRTHLIRGGRVISASDTDLQGSLDVIYHCMRSLQDLEGISNATHYKEIFNSTLDIIKRYQKDLLTKAGTEAALSMVQTQLSKSGLDLDLDLSETARLIDSGDMASGRVWFERALEGLGRAPADKVNRHLLSFRVQIEATFDRLNLSMVCRVVDTLQTSGHDTGFSIMIWRVGDSK